jgi:subtilisin family serine protease
VWWTRLLAFSLSVILAAVANLAFGQGLSGKMDAALAALMLEAGSPALSSLASHYGLDLSAPQPTIPVLILMQPGGGERLEQDGYLLKARIGEVGSVSIPLVQIKTLANHPDIVFMELAKRYRPILDRSIPDIQSNQLRARQPDGSFSGMTGKGIVIGAVDSGLDWRHPDFRKPDGSTRIKFLWDPSDFTFRTSNGTIGSPPPVGGHGTVYTEDQINAALQGKGTVNTHDECGHGTHVMGIAAGNGAGGNGILPPGTFIGAAPEADLIAVRVFDADCTFLGGFIDLVQAFQFIDQEAAILGRPYVLNLSLGTQIGAHDGTSLEEMAIDTLTASGKPGKAVVIAAGNDGNTPIHAGGAVGPAGSPNNQGTVQVSQGSPNAALFDFWFDGRDTFTVSLEGGGRPAEDLTPQVILNPLNGSKELLFQTDRTPTFTLTFSGQTVVNGRIDGWLEGNAAFLSQVDFSRLVGMPGTARHAITVGAYVTKYQWVDVDGITRVLRGNNILGALASFSCPGPTRDGRLKPELTAPGSVIGSALTGDAHPGVPGDTSIFSRAFVLQDGAHAIAGGTSMSAPHVTGAVALLLMRNTRLDAPAIQGILTTSARSDSFTGLLPNIQWGFGKLDVASAVVPTNPRIALSANQNVFTTGQTMILSVALQSGIQNNRIDGWLAVQAPDGALAFVEQDFRTFSSVPAPSAPSYLMQDFAGPLLTLQIPDGLLFGTYNFLALGTVPGADPSNPGNWITNLALLPLQIAPR